MLYMSPFSRCPSSGVNVALTSRHYVKLPTTISELMSVITPSSLNDENEFSKRNIRIKFVNLLKNKHRKITSSWRKNGTFMKMTSMTHKASNMTSSMRDNIKKFKYQKTVSINVPKGAHFDKELGSGWFDKDGKPLATKSKFGRYVIPWETRATNKSFADFLIWRYQRYKLSKTSGHQLVPPESKSQFCLPTVEPDIPTPGLHNGYTGGGKATWLGHSTVVFTVVTSSGEEGEKSGDIVNIITDPHFTPRASFLKYFGPKRYRSVFDDHPGLDSLGSKIDAVVISHDHFDHLDFGSLSILESSNSKGIMYYVPKGTKRYLTSKIDVPHENVVELAWWESAKLSTVNSANPVTITCLPSQHWCSRTPFDVNLRLWCSWSISSPLSKSYYYAGDTGLPDDFPLFETICDRVGPFDLSAIPIGAYKPRWFMRSQHVSPEEAVELHCRLGSKRSLAIHYGTFALADEGWNEPVEDLDEACRLMGLDRKKDFLTLPHGGSVEVSSE